MSYLALNVLCHLLVAFLGVVDVGVAHPPLSVLEAKGIEVDNWDVVLLHHLQSGSIVPLDIDVSSPRRIDFPARRRSTEVDLIGRNCPEQPFEMLLVFLDRNFVPDIMESEVEYADLVSFVPYPLLKMHDRVLGGLAVLARLSAGDMGSPAHTDRITKAEEEDRQHGFTPLAGYVGIILPESGLDNSGGLY